MPKLHINGWFVTTCLLAIILIAMVLIWIEESQAQQAPKPQHYMVIGRYELDFDCVETYPYTDTRRMDWNATDGLTEVDNDYRLHYWIIAVDSCNADAIYQHESGNYFALRFTDIECVDQRCAAHMTRGAWWIEP